MFSDIKVLENLVESVHPSRRSKPFIAAHNLFGAAQVLTASERPTVSMLWGIHPNHSEANAADLKTLHALHYNLQAIAGREVTMQLILPDDPANNDYLKSLIRRGSERLPERLTTTTDLNFDPALLIKIVGIGLPELTSESETPVLFARGKAKSGGAFINHAPWMPWL